MLLKVTVLSLIGILDILMELLFSEPELLSKLWIGDEKSKESSCGIGIGRTLLRSEASTKFSSISNCKNADFNLDIQTVSILLGNFKVKYFSCLSNTL